MSIITDGEQLLELADNSFVGTIPSMENSSIEFKGTGNILFCEEGVRLKNSKLVFNGSNAVIALGKSRHFYIANLTANNNCSILVGRNVYFNGVLNATASEERSIVIGDECLVSFGVWIRTADPHLVYSAESHERINPSRDVIIGDHVWIGQSALILKGSTVGSGSILGGMAVVAGKKIGSNSSWAGNPAKHISSGLFWERSCVHTWTASETEKRWKHPSDEFMFAPDDKTVSAKDFSNKLHGLASSKDRLDFWLSMSYDNAAHNRFAIAGEADARPKSEERGLFRRRK